MLLPKPIETDQPSTPYPSLRRFFLPKETQLPEPVSFPHPLTLTDKDLLHYLRDVLRIHPKKEVGHSILVIDRHQGIAYQATLERLEKDQLNITLTEAYPQQPMGLPHIVLAVGLIKGNRWDWLLQKATELGVSEIIPLLPKYGVVKAEETTSKLSRWEDILEAAASQSERLSIPKIHFPIGLNDLDASISSVDLALLLQERESVGEAAPQRQPLLTALQTRSIPCNGKIMLIIGAEGGWHPEELTQFYAQGVQPVSLGQLILRVETAVVASLATIMSVYNSRL